MSILPNKQPKLQKNLTDQKVKEIRLRNALAKEDAKMKW